MKELTYKSYVVIPLGDVISEWELIHADVSDNREQNAIDFTKKVIAEMKKGIDVKEKLPSWLLDVVQVNINLDLDHGKGDRNYGLSFSKWEDNKFYYASQLDSGKKPSNKSYFLGYILQTRIVFARMIQMGHIDVDNKEDAIKLLIG